MNEQTNPHIEWCNLEDKTCIKFSFKGELTEKDALKATKIWQQYFDAKANEKISLVWDCLNMTGYEPGARHHWQQIMKQLKGQIEVVWLITNSKVVRFGAKMLSVFTAYTIKVIENENQIIP